jgi:hypothetical protein
VRRNIGRHDRSGADNRAVSNRDAGENHRTHADPNIISDADGARLAVARRQPAALALNG